MEDSAAFFNKEVDKIISKISNAKTDRQRTKYLKQMMALRNRLALEIKMLDGPENFWKIPWQTFKIFHNGCAKDWRIMELLLLMILSFLVYIKYG